MTIDELLALAFRAHRANRAFGRAPTEYTDDLSAAAEDNLSAALVALVGERDLYKSALQDIANSSHLNAEDARKALK